MKKILFVEENEDTAVAIKIILENAGYYVDIVPNGRSSIIKARESDYDLILLDLMPPEMYGYDVYESIQKIQRTKCAFHSHVPLSLGLVKLFKKVGIEDHIVKPFNKIDLVTKLDYIFR